VTCWDVVVELRGFEPLTPCMPCHPHQFTTPCAALPGTTSALLSQDARQGAVVRREATCGIAADNLLTVGGLCRPMPTTRLNRLEPFGRQ
jgi:hypothetical protein